MSDSQLPEFLFHTSLAARAVFGAWEEHVSQRMEAVELVAGRVGWEGELPVIVRELWGGGNRGPSGGAMEVCGGCEGEACGVLGLADGELVLFAFHGKRGCEAQDTGVTGEGGVRGDIEPGGMDPVRGALG